MEGYIEFLISSMLNLHVYNELETSGDYLSFVLSILVCLMTVVMMVQMTWLFVIKRQQLGMKEIKEKYGSYYLELKIRESSQVLWFSFVFIGRRVIMGLSAIFLFDYPAF